MIFANSHNYMWGFKTLTNYEKKERTNLSVKSKDRHKSKRETLQKAHELMSYLLVLTRPREYNNNGKQIKKAGLLGEGQPFQAFGLDLFRCGKSIHAACYQACEIYLKDKETLEARTKLFRKAIEYCDSIFRLIDLCIYQYARNNASKRRSFEHLARLTKSMKVSILDRINRDNLIYNHEYKAPKTHRRGR